MGLIPWLIGSISGLIKRNSKVASLVIICSMVLLFGLDTFNKDYYYYSVHYSLVPWEFPPDYEVGYSVFASVFSLMHIPFWLYRCILSAGCLTLIYTGLRGEISSVAFVLSLYCLSIFWLDVTLVRNFISMSIVAFASLRYLGDKHSDLWFCALVSLAATVHISALFFLLFILAKRVSARKLLIIAVVLTAGLLVLIATGLHIEIARMLMSDLKVERYFGDRPLLGSLLSCFAVVFFLALCYLAYRFIAVDSDGQQTFVRNIVKCNIVVLPLCALLFINSSELFRIEKCVLLLDYAAVAYCTFEAKLAVPESWLKCGIANSSHFVPFVSYVTQHPKYVLLLLEALGVSVVFLVLATSHSFDGSFVNVMVGTFINLR